MTQNRKLYSAFSIICIVIFAGSYFFAKKTDAPVGAPVAPQAAVSQERHDALGGSGAVSNQGHADVSEAPAATKTFQLTGGDTTLSLPVTGGSLFMILSAEKERGAITFAGKEYPALGFFVTELGTLREGNGKHLMYTINGTEASVGVSSYVPTTGDVVVWELK